PFFMEFEEDFEQTILNAYERLKTGGWARKGDSSVIITNVLARDQVVETIQYRTVC
ncbi:MAG: pyruvate kinase, partial [Verrucomicrobia bacterium]|nr:pyruvate kinase [Verrucomicrobiota bacterium]